MNDLTLHVGDHDITTKILDAEIGLLSGLEKEIIKKILTIKFYAL